MMPHSYPGRCWIGWKLRRAVGCEGQGRGEGAPAASKALEEAGLRPIRLDGVSFDDDALVALIRGHAVRSGREDAAEARGEDRAAKVALRVGRDGRSCWPQQGQSPRRAHSDMLSLLIRRPPKFVGKPRFSNSCMIMSRDEAVVMGLVSEGWAARRCMWKLRS